MFYGALGALVDVTLDIEPGRLHALIGENGAGKSTLLKVAAGLVRVTRGSVSVEPRMPIAVVHQHFMLIDAFSVLENVVLGHEPVRLGCVDWESARRSVLKLMEDLSLEVDLDAKVSDLPVGDKQRIEILRAFYRGAKALFLDEPTAVLSPPEIDELYEKLRQLAESGMTIVVVTHHLREVIKFADRVTVMRHGHVMMDEVLNAEMQCRAELEPRITEAIMGTSLRSGARPDPIADGTDTLLQIKNIRHTRRDGSIALDDLSIDIRAGEILGIAGVEGNGQHELVRVLAGLEQAQAGSILVRGVDLKNKGPAERRAQMAVVHEDRHTEGLLLDSTVHDNLVVGEVGSLESETSVVMRRIQLFGIFPPDPQLSATALSGGNQQKIVVARAVDRLFNEQTPGVLVLAQPTRGVDIGASIVIRDWIVDAARRGLAVLVISSDLGELRALCHRIAVLRKGRIVRYFEPNAGDAEIGRSMLGTAAA